ncbi:MAG: protein arginine kinase [Verrucomicrobia bacterium]|nr:protein arginine kinase [Verrucomicrobiota bacterium]
MRFSTLIKHPADWMVGGDVDTAVVLTSRIRLARNVRLLPFPGWATKDQRRQTMALIQPVVQMMRPMKDAFCQTLSGLTSVQKQVLVERHLISREHAARNEGSAAVIERRQSLSIMINEEDHLRMQSIRPGLNLRVAFDALNDLDDELQESLTFAFDRKLGYLTTCPTNLGTGLRASAMLHLPALVLSEQINQVLNAIGRMGLAVRGLYGEGTESLGNLYQISNQSTLGESEHQIIERLERVIDKVAAHETNARLKLLEDDRLMLHDKIGRSYGILRHAWLIDSKEALNHLSLIRLGANLGFFPHETVRLCDNLLMEIQPAHLQLHSGKKLSPEQRDESRGQIIRTQLQSIPTPAMVFSQTKKDSFPEPPLDIDL